MRRPGSYSIAACAWGKDRGLSALVSERGQKSGGVPHIIIPVRFDNRQLACPAEMLRLEPGDACSASQIVSDLVTIAFLSLLSEAAAVTTIRRIVVAHDGDRTMQSPSGQATESGRDRIRNTDVSRSAPPSWIDLGTRPAGRSPGRLPPSHLSALTGFAPSTWRIQ